MGLAVRSRRPRSVHRCCRTYDFANAVAGVRRRGADAGHAGSYRRLADTGRRQPGHPGRVDRRPARTRRHRCRRARRSPNPPAVSCFSTPPPPRCCPSTATDCRRGMQRRCSATVSVRVWRRSTSCCRARFRGVTRGWPMRRPCTWAAPASRWPTPSGRSPRAATRSGRWCSPPCRTWPTRAASTHRDAARCGRTRMCRRVRPSTRAKPSQGFSSVSRRASATSWWRSGRVPAARLAEHNANLVGGDIGVGGNTLFHALAGPTPRLNPWSTPIPKVYLCSSATPPGGGVHGMSGYYAARTVLRREFGIKKLPRLAP